jgi:tetratricopeptide (TPR) repeat protein
MKKYLLFIYFIFISVIAFTQNKPKPVKPQEKPPTQKEMDEMMKEMENMYKNLNLEERKLYDSMGVKFPNIKNMPKLSDKQLADAWEADGKLFPAKKTVLINTLPKRIFTNTELSEYIKRINSSIAPKLNPKAKQLADKVLEQYKTDKNYGGMVAAAANGMWVLGFKEPAVYLMGKAVELLPNADNYNNFAAYLTMTGAAHISIPILEKLNSIHKKNSTIYNNLGHAWLELGDVAKGENYLDSAINIYKDHPQANFTKALLLEAKGKTNDAIAAVERSLKHSVTEKKLDKLKQLRNKQLTMDKYRYPKMYFSATFNPGKYLDYMPGAYAITAGMKIEKQWLAFREEMQQEMKRIDIALAKNKTKVESELKDLQAKNKKYGRPALSPHYMRALATHKNQAVTDVFLFPSKAEIEEDADYLKEWSKLKMAFEKELTGAKDSIEQNEPNGSPLLLNNCPVVLPIVNKHVKLINKLNENYRNQKLRRWLSDAYQGYNYYMSIAVTESVAMEGILNLRKKLVDKLLLLKHEAYDLPECLKEDKINIAPFTSTMSDFDEVTCSSESTLYIPLTGQIIIRCNRMDVIFNPAMIPVNFSFTSNYYGNNHVITDASIGISIKATDLNVSGHFDKEGKFLKGDVALGQNIKGVKVSVNGEFNAEGFKKGSVELGIDGKMELLPKTITEAAPLQLGMKGEMAAGFEVNEKGTVDFIVKEKTGVEMGASVEADIAEEGQKAIKYTNEIIKGIGAGDKINIPEPKVSSGASISADNRWSVNTGHTVNRSGEFSWLKNE